MNFILAALPWKKIIIGIVIIFALWLAWRKFGYKFEQLTQARKIDLLPGENEFISPEKKSEIENIGSELYNDIYDTPGTGHNYDPYTSALKLTQNELNYLADYYKKYLSANISLWKDIDTQYYITSGIPAQLQVRLNAIGKK